MIPRYSRPEMAGIWTEEHKLRTWLRVELLACEAWAQLGKIPAQALATIKEKANFSAERVAEIEDVTKHDVIAFLTAVGEHVGPDSRFMHFGLTSSDMLDTALAVNLREASDLVIRDLNDLLGVLKERALEHKNTVMIGRSHGVHAEPITFGLKMALWYTETQRNLERMERAKQVISVGKVSGAVGTFAHSDPRVEQYVCDKLGLKAAQVSTQIIQRDRHADFMTALALIASSLDKFATEVRSLQRTEILEAEEYFEKGQKGSSAMPHKRNPIRCEQISGLARVVRANAMAALENIALWHERDISHSSVERVIIPDSCILIDYLLARFTGIIKKLLVYPDNMRANLEKTKGMFFSERILLELVGKGLTREEAYGLVQRNAMKVWAEGMDFRRALLADRDIMSRLSEQELDECFDLQHHLRFVDQIFQRAGLNSA
ncbi:MAG: adenylosuccinate lyase [Candidatus Abyssobacteria bacterium SURF_5]|uniref:Adenylosuccinate lyase n=1 Tax=Abyssobacteria bacterium (strain SURF_5) TaxID=2093360 RepID=A0A3A4NX89_ABYX5|nr:MAG: adenylosuccinate lyase [Candidatus Abyssubacteria bacterium SURF_5]